MSHEVYLVFHRTASVFLGLFEYFFIWLNWFFDEALPQADRQQAFYVFLTKSRERILICDLKWHYSMYLSDFAAPEKWREEEEEEEQWTEEEYTEKEER